MSASRVEEIIVQFGRPKHPLRIGIEGPAEQASDNPLL